MKNCFRITILTLLLPASMLAADVLTYHNDNARTGQNPGESTLTPSIVNYHQFGRLFSRPLDGYVYAQPLYVSNLAIPGKGTHNVVFVATEHDTVYAFDADSNIGPNAHALWRRSFINPPSITTVPSEDTGTEDLVPQVGITGTPVIDASSGTLYVVAKTKEHGEYFQRLHALDITTGAEKFGGPVVIQATVPGTGDGSDHIDFDPLIEHQRSALLLSRGVVYIAWASHGDNGPYHGWILGYNATTLQQVAVFNSTPNGTLGGIWMAGGGLAADDAGNIYGVTGNGTFDIDTPRTNFGDTLLKFATDSNGALSVADFFTPFDQQELATDDLDLGSSGPVLLPDQPGGSPHLLVFAGKNPKIYLVDRDNLGQFNASSDQIVQSVTGEIPGSFGTPGYFNGRIYYHGSQESLQETLKAFDLSGGVIDPNPSSESTIAYGFPGAVPSISADGASNGIVWETQRGVTAPGVLHAYDANDVSNELYNSSQAGARDTFGLAVKFAPPTVANGKVFVGAANRLAVFGIFRTGIYNGLVDSGTFESSGFAHFVVTRGNVFTARIRLGSALYTVTGRFDASDTAVGTFILRNGDTANFSFQFAENGAIAGTISSSTFTANFSADKSGLSTQAPGRFTAVLEPDPNDNSTQVPHGAGYAVLTVSSAGTVRVAGRLPDHSPFSESVSLSQDNSFPLFASLYEGRGAISGVVTFESLSATDLDGTLQWTKGAHPGDRFYPAGFTTTVSLGGSQFTPSNPVLNFMNGQVTISGDDLGTTITKTVTLHPNNFVTVNTPADDRLVVSILTNGIFRGTFFDVTNNVTRTFSGALVQRKDEGAGFFLGMSQAGLVRFQPAP